MWPFKKADPYCFPSAKDLRAYSEATTAKLIGDCLPKLLSSMKVQSLERNATQAQFTASELRTILAPEYWEELFKVLRRRNYFVQTNNQEGDYLIVDIHWGQVQTTRYYNGTS